MVRNFVEFARYPWAAQCLEMARRTGGINPAYRRDAFGAYIMWGAFRDVLQRGRSVGCWRDSVQGREYWVDIFRRNFGSF